METNSATYSTVVRAPCAHGRDDFGNGRHLNYQITKYAYPNGWFLRRMRRNWRIMLRRKILLGDDLCTDLNGQTRKSVRYTIRFFQHEQGGIHPTYMRAIRSDATKLATAVM